VRRGFKKRGIGGGIGGEIKPLFRKRNVIIHLEGTILEEAHELRKRLINLRLFPVWNLDWVLDVTYCARDFYYVGL
jgi:hypothetical protein